jgi:PhoH-like ATPase
MKTFVLDTNIILHDPAAILSFEEHTVVIPMAVVEELDNFKKGSLEINHNAREATRILDHLRTEGKLLEGVKTEEGGTVKVAADLNVEIEKLKPDDRILQCALNSKKKGVQVVLVTKDVNLRIKADARDVVAEDYSTDASDQTYTGMSSLPGDEGDIEAIFNGGLALEEVYPNQFVTLENQNKTNHTALGRVHSDGTNHVLRPLNKEAMNPMGIRPRNREQQCMLDLMMDPNIKLVTVTGPAGCGKTLLALAASLAQTMEEELYQRVLVCRPIVPMGNDVGFLPGDLDAKLAPYMQPIFDNVEFIASCNPKRAALTPGQLIEAGYLSVEPLTFIRGRSLPGVILIADEAQNLTPKEVKALVTRIGEGSKVILCGDPDQIDSAYLDKYSNGLSYVVERFKNEKIAGHITLVKGERSELSELASKLL